MTVGLRDVINKLQEVEDAKVNHICTIDGVTVGSTSTVVLAANPSRKSAKFINDDDEVIYLARGDVAEMNKGIPLNPNRMGVYEINPDDPYYGIVTAICTSGSKNLCVEECE